MSFIDEILSCVVFYLQLHSSILKKLIDHVEFLFSENCVVSLFHDGRCYHIETSPLIICSANQWTGFYMIMAPVMKELKSMKSSTEKFTETALKQLN